MVRRYVHDCLDRVAARGDFTDLFDLTTVVCSAPSFDERGITCGLPLLAFVYIETLMWISQACRSGVLTYYEATPNERQAAMLAGLQTHAPEAFAQIYERGMRDWRNSRKIKAVDKWIDANDAVVQDWLRTFAVANRDFFASLDDELEETED